MAETMLQAARRRLELWGVPQDEIEALERDRRPSDHMRIDAPAEGWVLEREGFEGMYVETGTRLFTVADLRALWVLLDAYELDVGAIRLGQNVEFETEAFPGKVFSGLVAYIDPVLDTDTRTVKVRVNVANPDLKLRPGMFVRARLQVRLGEGGQVVDNPLAGKWVCYMHPEIVKDEPGQCDICEMDLVPAESVGYAHEVEAAPKALAIPRTAVLRTGTRAVVYVERQEDGRTIYEGRTLRLGPKAGDYYIIEEGLAAGERVVTRGALMIDSAMQIQARPSMMQPEAEDPFAVPELPSRYVAGGAYHTHAAPILDAYFELMDRLAADDAEGGAGAADRFRAALERIAPADLEGEDAEVFTGQMSAIRAALPPTDDPSIDQLRELIPELTLAMETYLRSFGHQRPAVYVMYCPMARDDQGAKWLQPDPAVLNPYFGASMLRCGEVAATLGPDGQEVGEVEEHVHEEPPEELVSRRVPGAAYHEQAAPVLEAYFELNTALAAEDAGEASRAAAAIRKALEGAEPEGLEGEDAEAFTAQMAAIRKALPDAAEPTLDQLRGALPALTLAMKTYLRTFGHERPGPVYVVYCPMVFDFKGESWLDSESRVLNPYFAHRMLRCGEVREGIGGDGEVTK